MPSLQTWLETDYYDRLGVSPDATQGDIVRAFRRQARAHHPDVATSPDATAFQQATEAYEVLSDVWARDRYDRVRSAASQRGLLSYDHQDLPEEDRWIGHFQATMSATGFSAMTRGSGYTVGVQTENPLLAMNPWWNLYRNAWRMAS